MKEKIDDILIEELHKIIDPLKIKLIELSAIKGRNGLNIKIVIDKDNGVTINDCEKITRLYNNRLIVFDLIENENYNLQISSPGIDRVLKKIDEYSFFNGRKVKIFLHEMQTEGYKSNIICGVLKGMEKNIVKLETEYGTIEIPFSKIKKTKLDG